MTRYAQLQEMKQKFEMAENRTTGTAKIIWQQKIFAIDEELNSMTIEQAERKVRRIR